MDSKDGTVGTLSNGVIIVNSEAVRFLDWYSKTYDTCAYSVTRALDRLPEESGYVYNVFIQGKPVGRGDSSDKAAAKRRAELGGAMNLINAEPHAHLKWMEADRIQKQADWANQQGQHAPALFQPADPYPHPYQYWAPIHHQPSNLHHAASVDPPRPDLLQQAMEVSTKLADQLKLSDESLVMARRDRDSLSQECEQLRAEVKQMREERERQGSIQEPATSSTESSLPALVEIATPQEVSLKLLELQSELSQIKFRRDSVESH